MYNAVFVGVAMCVLARKRRECALCKMLPNSERLGMKIEVARIEKTAHEFEYRLNPYAVEEVMEVMTSLIC